MNEGEDSLLCTKHIFAEQALKKSATAAGGQYRGS